MPPRNQRKPPDQIPETGRVPLMPFRFTRQTRQELEAIIPRVTTRGNRSPSAAATLVQLIHEEYQRMQAEEAAARKAPSPRALAAAGFVMGDAEQFLDLSPTEAAAVEERLAQHRAAQARRRKPRK